MVMKLIPWGIPQEDQLTKIEMVALGPLCQLRHVCQM